MPLYEYRCQECGELFEEIVRLRTKDEEVPCPSCGAHRAHKEQSTFSVRSGSGGSGGTSSHCGPTGSS